MALVKDAGTIARHRALMFRDMGLVTQEESDNILLASLPWFEQLIARGEYVGWLVQMGAETVAGGGIHLRETGPMPGCYRTGTCGHIANIYTEQAHRRHGIARLLLKKILEWGALNRVDQLTLSPSDEGRRLYESFGFIPTFDMRLPRPSATSPQATSETSQDG